MSYYILGSNHELSDTSFSSQIAFSNYKKDLLLNNLYQSNLADYVLILSTCNRSEVFVYKKNIESLENWTESVKRAILNIHNLDISYINKFYQKINTEAYLHLFKVACGLDSLVIGEPQILGQIKDAVSYTEEYHKVHSIKIPSEFYKLIDETYACAKEVRTNTSIGKFAVSIAFMACQIARKILTDLKKEKVTLIGASETNLLIAKHLVRNGITNITVVNRTLDNAKSFIDNIGCGSFASLESLEEILITSTLVFSSTSSSSFILNKDLVKNVQLKRNFLNFTLFDLAIPNDIDPKIRSIENVHLYNRDDLQKLVNKNIQKRQSATQEAIPILAKYLNRFREQNRILQGNEIIVEYRNSVHQHRINLVNNAKEAIKKGADIEEVLDSLSYSLTNKVLHTPTLMLSSFIKNGQTCELKSIHEFLDRNDRYNLSSVVENTLNKEEFKNNCCKNSNSNITPSYCSQNNSANSSFSKLITKELLPDSSSNTSDVAYSKNEDQVYRFTNTNSIKEKPKLSSFNDIKGFFVPLDFNNDSTVLNELIRIVDNAKESNNEESLYTIHSSKNDKEVKLLVFNN